MAAKPAGYVKPLDGQMSLLDDPPIRYCRRCGRRLKNVKSQECRLGPRCRRIERERETPADDSAD